VGRPRRRIGVGFPPVLMTINVLAIFALVGWVLFLAFGSARRSATPAGQGLPGIDRVADKKEFHRPMGTDRPRDLRHRGRAG